MGFRHFPTSFRLSLREFRTSREFAICGRTRTWARNRAALTLWWRLTLLCSFECRSLRPRSPRCPRHKLRSALLRPARERTTRSVQPTLSFSFRTSVAFLRKTVYFAFFSVMTPGPSPPGPPSILILNLISSPLIVPSCRIFMSPPPPSKLRVNEILSPSTLPSLI
jgi:hypothetical protein